MTLKDALLSNLAAGSVDKKATGVAQRGWTDKSIKDASAVLRSSTVLETFGHVTVSRCTLCDNLERVCITCVTCVQQTPWRNIQQIIVSAG